MPEFVIILEGREVERVQFDKDLIAIGRARENDIVIENLATSRHHAQISSHGGQYYLTDLDSSNGTMLNEKRISRAALGDGDTIRVGKHEIRFVVPDGETPLVPEDDFSDFNQTMMIPAATPPGHFLAVRAIRRRDTAVPLTQDRIDIGRGPACDIRLVDWFVDPQQAIIEIRGADCSVRNMGRTRPTLVNGQPVRETLLQDGDVIQAGFTQLAYTTDQTKALDHPGLRPLQEIQLPPETGSMEPGDSTEDSAMAEAAIIAESAAAAEDFEPAEPEGSEIDTPENESPPKPDPEQEYAPADDEADEVDAMVDSSPQIVSVGIGQSMGEALEPEIIADLDLDEETDDPKLHPSGLSDEEMDFDLADISLNVEAVEAWNDEDTAAHQTEPEPEPEEEPEAAEPEDFTLDDTSPAPSVEEPLEETPEEIEPEPAEVEERDTTAPVEADEQAEEQPKEAPAAEEVAPASDTQDRRVAMWEKALQNPSAAVRKQAAAQLKRLTGREYDV